MADLIDIVLEGFKKVVGWIISLFLEGLRSGYEDLTQAVFGTPTPQTSGVFVFGTPTNEPWRAIQNALVGGEMMLISLLLLAVCVQGYHSVRIFNLGSSYAAQKAKKNAWVGVFIIVTWYWMGVLVLYLVDGFTIALMPEFNTVRAMMLEFLRASITNPALALGFAFIGGLSMWVLQALFYIREILLYVYLYGMPIAIALAYGNLPVLSDIAMGFCKRFVPLAVLPLPAAMVFKGYDLLYSGGSFTPPTPFLKHLVAASLPLIALYVTWKTFTYATPLTARVIGTASRGAVTVGAVATGAYVGGASVATTAARWGPKAAAGHAVADRVSAHVEGSESEYSQSYRRTENEPGTTKSQ